jgi:hypothetical protein
MRSGMFWRWNGLPSRVGRVAGVALAVRTHGGAGWNFWWHPSGAGCPLSTEGARRHDTHHHGMARGQR